jgi:predicted ATP-dependent serine protease
MVARMKTKKKRVYECITCGEEISEKEYEDNAGQCDNCVAEDTVYAAPEELGF